MGSSVEKQYVLGGGSPEVARLRIQAQALEPHAGSLLDEIHVAAGWSALDLACGPGGILRPLSRRVGSAGRVVGLDFDPAEVAAASEYVRAEGLSNVEVVQGDAFHTQFQASSFDLVHARFLVAPMGRGRDLLSEMIRLAKPGGFVVQEEPESNGWSCFPESAGFERLKDVIRECFRLGGGSFDAGRELLGLQRQAGLAEAHTRGVALTLHDGQPYMRATAQFADSLKLRILENRLMTESQLDQAINDVERAVSRPETFMISFLVIQAWGKKPGPATPRHQP